MSKKLLYHCLSCKNFDFDSKILKFKCKINKAEPDNLIYAFERKICNEWEGPNGEKMPK